MGGAGVHIQKPGKLSNGCTDCPQIWYTSADSSGNGHRLNTIRPTIPQGHFGVFLGGHKLKCLGKLSNGWTDLHQIWYNTADSSGNGHMLNTIRPSIPQGVLGGHKFKSLGKLSNNWTDWHQIWYTSVDSSGNGHRLNTIRSSISQGAFGGGGGLGGHNLKSLLKLSKGWTDWHTIWHTRADSSGNGYTPNRLPLETQGGHLGFYGSNIQTSGEAVNRWPDWHQLWFTSADSSGNGHMLKTSRPTIPQGALGGGGV